VNKLLICFFFLSFTTLTSVSQDAYWIYFIDKDSTNFDPHSFFDQKAIKRRVKNGGSLYDPSDFPVKSSYIERVKSIVELVDGTSRWMNALYCVAFEDQINVVRQFPFVLKTEQVPQKELLPVASYTKTIPPNLSSLANAQTKVMQGDLFKKRNISGKGIRIAVIDAGFSGANTSEVFKHLREKKLIVATWDFMNKNENVYRYNQHGTAVLSCLGGIKNGQQLGLATESEYLLAKVGGAYGTYKRGFYAQEKNWIEAIEWADRNGADIISISLIIPQHRFFPDELDGKSHRISKIAAAAARKGLLIVNAAGNEGENKFSYVLPPSDCDSVLTVGAIHPLTGYHAKFSSHGPTADKRLKPNVCGMGYVVAPWNLEQEMIQGTSFSTPLVAGFAACAWQSDTSLTAMEVFKALEKSADLYPYFDYYHGYGVPQASYFLKSKVTVLPTFNISIKADTISITIKEEFFENSYESLQNDEINFLEPFKETYYNLTDSSSLFNIEHSIKDFHYENTSSAIQKFESHIKRPNYLYLHIENSYDYLDAFHVYAVQSKNALKILNKKEFKGKIIRIHYNGYTYVHEL